MALFSLICCLLALTSSVLSNSAYGRAPVSWNTGLTNDNSKVTGLRELTQAPMQTGYGAQQQQQPQQQQNIDLSLGSTQDTQQDKTWQTLVSSPRVISSGGYGAQVPRSQITFGQNEQAVVAPQSNYGGQQLTRQITLGQNEQNSVAPQSNYGGQQLTRQVQLGQNEQSVFVPQTNYGAQRIAVQQPRAYVSPKQLLLEQQQLLQQKIDEAQIVTEADVLCRGKQPETIIPLDGGRRFVTCLDDSKGYEQQCPKGLILHPETRRCERKSGPLDNPCANYPCLNNGKCVQTDHSSYECQCQQGFDGTHCELDAIVCHTQKPCGQSAEIKCQSFRAGAALTHVCVHKSGQAYGLSSQLTHGNPCRAGDDDVPKPLGVSDGGFVMCDGDSMYVESCPGGTVWSNNQKSCVWAETEYINSLTEQPQVTRGYGQQVQYNQQPRIITTQSGYGGGEVQIERPLPKARTLVEVQRPLVNEEQRVFSNYGQGSFQQQQQQQEQQPNPRSQVGHQSVGRQPDFRHLQQQQQQQQQQPSNY